MNINIFSPKGKIDQIMFLVNYIILLLFYIVGGIFIISFIYKHNLSFLYFAFPLLIVKILITFNYKKRIMDVTEKSGLSVILALILAFDTELLTMCQMVKNSELSMILFVGFGLFFLLVQPAIVALLPSKSNQ